MEPKLNLLAVLSLLGAAQGVLLSLALLSIGRGNRTVNRILAAFIAVVSIFICGAVLRTTNYVYFFPHLSRVHDPFPFLAGPLLFLYLRELTRRSGLRKWDALHFIPFIVCVLYLIPYFFQSRESKLNYLISEYFQPDMGRWYYVRSMLVITQSLAYLILIVFMLVPYVRRVRNQKSEADRAALLQVRFLVGASLLLWIVAALRFTLDSTSSTNLLVPLGFSVVVYVLGYMGLRQPEILAGIEEAVPPAPRYEKSTLTPERSERYLKRLLHLMETEKPYMDGELTLQKLAFKLAIPAQHLSQTINERLKQTFTEFINTYRVEEAKRLLLDPAMKHYSVLAIAEEVGFNSKSSFNAVFKKQVNMTPSEFRKISMDNGSH